MIREKKRKEKTMLYFSYQQFLGCPGVFWTTVVFRSRSWAWNLQLPVFCVLRVIFLKI
jgi:hypothetical protein